MSEEQIKDLVRKRGTFKSRLTSFMNFLNNLAEPVAPHMKLEVELRTSKLEALFDDFNVIQFQIECECENPSEQY